MAKRPLLIAVLAGAVAAVVIPMAVFGLPYGRFDAESFVHLYTYPPNGNETHLHIDADITNGSRPCDPIDGTATVRVGDVHKVGVCLETYDPNSVEAFELHIHYDSVNVATEVPDVAPALDDNPDANDGDDPTGFMLGSNWDCTGFSVQMPMGDDPTTPGVADAKIICNANIMTPDLDLAADPGLLATVEFTAIGVGVDIIDFGPIDANNKNAVANPRPNCGIARCGTAVPADTVGCFGAIINKVPPCDCEFIDDFYNDTSLCLRDSTWEFTWPDGSASGMGYMLSYYSRIVMLGRGSGFIVFALGTCPSGPGTALAIDWGGVPFQFLRLYDVTPW
jgi:hypothetical protein